jgi:hypothetical protein
LFLDIHLIWAIVWDSTKYEQFRSALEYSASTSNPNNVSEFIDNVYNAAALTGLFKEIKLSSSGMVRGPSWFNSECVQAKKLLQNNLRRLRKAKRTNHNNFNNILADYVKSKKDYKNVEKSAKTYYYTNIQEKLRNSKNAKEFYNALTLYMNKNKDTNTKVMIPIEEFKAFFTNIFELQIEEVQSVAEINNLVVEDLDDKFTLAELELAIKKLKPNKAPGSDGIPNEVWKSMPNINKSTLLDLFNNIFDTGEFPKNLCEIIMTPLYKKSDPALPTNYRPLSLANTLLKLFTQLISNRLLNWSTKHKIISDYQAAYKRNSGCRDHVFLLTSIIQYNFHINRKVYGLFVDMSKAFDTVNHNRLWFKLNKLGVSSKIIKILKSIYSKANAKIRTKYDISETFSIDRGVLQGETVSPVLWNMYLEDLVKALDDSDTIPVRILDATIHALLYADDIILLAYSPAELQKKINILNVYLKDNGLQVNLSKTKYMIFSKRADRERLVIKWDNERIDRVDSYVYLGVPFTEQLNFEFTKNYFVSKTELALKQVESLIFRSKMNDFGSILSLFYSLVRSVFSYCSPIWALNFSDSYEKLRIQFLKRLFLLPGTTPAFFVRLELGLKSSDLFFLKTCLKFLVILSCKNTDSLMYKAYNTMKCIVDYKKSWFKNIINLCAKWNCVNLLDLLQDTNISITSKIRRINKQISIREQDSISLDIGNMRKSKMLSLYNSNKTHCILEPFLKDNYSWSIKQLVIQLKLGISHLTHKGIVAKLGKLEEMYGYISSNLCQLCGKREETTYHVMFECPHYITERVKYIHKLSKFDESLCESNYLCLFNNLSSKDAISLYYFFNCSLTRRKLYLEEMSVPSTR